MLTTLYKNHTATSTSAGSYKKSAPAFLLEAKYFAHELEIIIPSTLCSMRFLAAIPIVFCTTSFVLAFLCLFAGNRKGFMEDYAILTVIQSFPDSCSAKKD